MAPYTVIRRDDTLAAYLDQVRRIEPLTDDQQAALFARYRAGDAWAGEQLVMANLRTVVRIAARYHAQFASLADLIQEGNLGLLRALDKYDPTRNIPFSAYARYWIRAMILRFVMENHRLVRVGRTRNSRRVFFELARERQLLAQRGEPTDATALARRLGIPEHEMDALRHALSPEESLDAPTEGHGWHEVLGARGDDPETHAARAQLLRTVSDLVAAFADTITSDRERAILREHLLADDPVSFAELGRRYGVSRERIRQQAARLTDRLRVFLLEELGADLAADLAA